MNKQIRDLSLPVFIIIGLIIFLKSCSNSEEKEVFVGIFETTEINVGAEIPGRVDSVYVKLGDFVFKGQLLAKIESNILDAKREQAQGIYNVAKSIEGRAEKGTRAHQIEAVKSAYNMTVNQYELAHKTYIRMKAMHDDSLISGQKMDEFTFAYKASENEMNSAKSLYDLAIEGASKEDIDITKGQSDAAQGLLNEADAYYSELAVFAPIAGQISAKLAEESEIMPAGYPIFTILKIEDIHCVLNIVEDKLHLFKEGTIVNGSVAGLEGRSFEFEVQFIAPMADFADWLPTADKGKTDMKTFEIHLYPVKAIDGLRPGMSLKIEE